MGKVQRQQVFGEADYLNWEPYSLAQMHSLVKAYQGVWCFAGAYALELFLGYAYRGHGDIDLLFLRKDQHKIRLFFADWELYMGIRPGLAYWEEGASLQSHIYDIWARKDQNSPWRFQIMLLDTDGEQWLYKRDPKIRGALEKAILYSSDRIPFLSPEIQLLYKAKIPFREKDQQDFEELIPFLNENQRSWLLASLLDQYSSNHPWVSLLS